MTISKKKYKEILEKADIVQIIKHYLGEDSLHKRSKKGSWGDPYTGLCPFHKEKTPSFSVNVWGQYFHCYGCGVSGNVVGFVSKYRGLTGIEAIFEIAAILGMSIPSGKTNSARARRRIRPNTLKRNRRKEIQQWKRKNPDPVPF